MGLIQALTALFGGNRNTIAEVAQVFRVNAEASDARGFDLDTAALNQFAAEFVARSQRTWWDSLVDGLNRLPRPLFTAGVFALLGWTFIDPVKMAEVFGSWAIIPTPVWALITVVVTFFFGGRAQVKDQDFQRDMAGVMASTQTFLSQRRELRALAEEPALQTVGGDDDTTSDPNPALADWRTS
ncbi:carboxylesterase [Sagittula sp. NFXS13]|uniref:3TM-type holin n=1 Tax=Sagittula sp. NFXS13 TaxID=2819095 RepID=UPI0032DE8F50